MFTSPLRALLFIILLQLGGYLAAQTVVEHVWGGIEEEDEPEWVYPAGWKWRNGPLLPEECEPRWLKDIRISYDKWEG